MTGYLVVLFLRRTVDQYLGSLSEVHKCDGAGIAYPLVIYYFDNDSEASEVLTMGEEDDTADFDHAPFRGVDLNLGHPEREYLRSISVFTHDRCHNPQTYLWIVRVRRECRVALAMFDDREIEAHVRGR